MGDSSHMFGANYITFQNFSPNFSIFFSPPRSRPPPLPPRHRRACERIPLRHRSNLQEKNNIVIPEFSAWLTLVLEQCRAENIRNLPRQRAPTPLFPERRPREACSMPISGRHDLPLATFNLPSRNNLQNKPNSAAAMSLPCSRFATAQPQRRGSGQLSGCSGAFNSVCQSGTPVISGSWWAIPLWQSMQVRWPVCKNSS